MADHTFTDFERMLSTFAHHCACIMTDEAPTKFRCGIGFSGPNNEDRVEMASVEITPTTVEWDENAGNSVCDGVKVNGKPCGNRCGGRDELARLMAPILAEAARCLPAMPKREAA